MSRRVLAVLSVVASIALPWANWVYQRARSAKEWQRATAHPPWGTRPSIYDHIRAHLSPDGKGLTPGGATLPDEKPEGAIRFAPGMGDALFAGHEANEKTAARAKELEALVRAVMTKPSEKTVGALYAECLREPVVAVVDPLLERLRANSDFDGVRLDEVADWLARNAADREAVKLGVALLGVRASARHRELLLTLGRHEELTLYAAVVLANMQYGERDLFALARAVDGWGRIQIVSRFDKTEDPAIKAWMLREGFRNSIMDEYLAYTCATTGGLRAALQQPTVDPALLAGAGGMLAALLRHNGPAESIDDYADGAAVVTRYLELLDSAPRALDQLLVVHAVRQFLDEKADWTAREQRGWTPALRAQLSARCIELEHLPAWRVLIREGLASKDHFAVADDAARVVGIDTWPDHFARLQAGEDDWYWVMQTQDVARIDRVLAFAEQHLPLDQIATGPADELGLDRRWVNHQHLVFVVQGLQPFPGKGWNLVRAALRSPVVSNRNMALRVLSLWGQPHWPSDAVPALERAVREEPREELKATIRQVLAGKPLDEPGRQPRKPAGP